MPLNIVLAGLVYALTRDMNRALNMLIIDYSCGIKLSTAAALSAAINTAARQGVFIKGSGVIESMSKADTLILDKTGTLTEGKPCVESIVPQSKKFTQKDIVCYAAAEEETSKHPMASAILDAATREGVRIPQHGDVNTIVGRGVYTTVGGSTIRVGNKKFLNESGIHTHSMREQASALFAKGENVVFVSKDDEIAGLIGIRDPLRENMKKALNRLRNVGVDDIVLLTGDLEQQADVVARRLGTNANLQRNLAKPPRPRRKSPRRNAAAARQRRQRLPPPRKNSPQHKPRISDFGRPRRKVGRFLRTFNATRKMTRAATRQTQSGAATMRYAHASISAQLPARAFATLAYPRPFFHTAHRFRLRARFCIFGAVRAFIS